MLPYNWRTLSAPVAAGLACALAVLSAPTGNAAPTSWAAQRGVAPADDITPSWRCAGTGSDGNRIQLVYLRPAGAKDRFAEVRDKLESLAGYANGVYLASAAEQGGYRELRWATDTGQAGCRIDISRTELPEDKLKTASGMQAELRAKGYNRADRKYMVMIDHPTGTCGVALPADNNDDRPGPDNANNSGNTHAFGTTDVWGDYQCWGGDLLAHELTHTLGAVVETAPNANPKAVDGHCLDAYELMCYDDKRAAPIREVCPKSHRGLLDCGQDDYFALKPKLGSWLAGHWNVANSDFLFKAPA